MGVHISVSMYFLDELAPLSLYDDLLCLIAGGSNGKESACNAEMQVQSLVHEDPLEKEMATHSRILTWRIPWIEEPGRLQSMRSQTDTTE